AGARVDHGDLDSTVQLPTLLRAVGTDGVRADHLRHLDTTGIDTGRDQRTADRSRAAFAEAVTKRMTLADLDVGLQHESLIRVPSRPRGDELDLLPALRANVCRRRREMNRFERTRSTRRSSGTCRPGRPWRTRWARRAGRPRRARQTSTTCGAR